MNKISLTKVIQSIMYLCTHPQESFSWIRRGSLLTDREVVRQTYWLLGDAPRKLITDIIPETRTTSITLPRAFDRTFRTSITIHEACALASIVRGKNVKKILEIGTFDGNTALLFASNLGAEGSVVTVDLPPTFDPIKDKSSLAHSTTKINLTPRNTLASQYQHTEASARITQVYGDSSKLDWNTFKGPFDLIFIDGCHEETYVRDDSKNALTQLTSTGIIVWHDYGEIPDVSNVVDVLVKETPNLSVCVIEGTRLAVGFIHHS